MSPSDMQQDVAGSAAVTTDIHGHVLVTPALRAAAISPSLRAPSISPVLFAGPQSQPDRQALPKLQSRSQTQVISQLQDQFGFADEPSVSDSSAVVKGQTSETCADQQAHKASACSDEDSEVGSGRCASSGQGEGSHEPASSITDADTEEDERHLESPGRFAETQIALIQQRQQQMQTQRLAGSFKPRFAVQPKQLLQQTLEQPASSLVANLLPVQPSRASSPFKLAQHAQQGSLEGDAVAYSPVVLFSPGGPYSDKSNWYTSAVATQVLYTPHLGFGLCVLGLSVEADVAKQTLHMEVCIKPFA